MRAIRMISTEIYEPRGTEAYLEEMERKGYHLAGRRFDFELLSGLILCCLFRCSQNLKFLLDFC